MKRDFFLGPKFLSLLNPFPTQFTGAFFIFTSGIIGVALVLYIFVKILMKKIEEQSSKYEKEENNSPQEDVELLQK